MSPFLRPYTPTDKQPCLEAFKSNVPLFFTEAEITDFSNFLDSLPRRQAEESTRYYVLKLNNQIIGAGGFGDKDNTGKLSLAWGLVHRDFHKKGYGEALLKHRLEEIKRLYPSKNLVLDTTQHSYGFFEKYGFVVTQFTPDFYEKGMHRYDMVFTADSI
ncbi:MAG TPA: GNAT family N-acetyltransferase [Fluviicola sp.]|nr:GNAT family N-acetyltransferase [Fluviicola sp.]